MLRGYADGGATRAELSEEDETAGSEVHLDLSTVYVSFSAEINANTTESLISTMANCANQGVDEVVLLLSTPGGDVSNGINLYNVLRAMPFRLVTDNVANVDSIGNIIFLAGEERFACAHSTFMFHGVGVNQFTGAPRLEEKYLRELLDGVSANHTRMGSIMEERTDLDATQVQALFLEAQTKDGGIRRWRWDRS